MLFRLGAAARTRSPTRLVTGQRPLALDAERRQEDQCDYAGKPKKTADDAPSPIRAVLVCRYEAQNNPAYYVGDEEPNDFGTLVIHAGKSPPLFAFKAVIISV